jgi:hypothetical protein
LAEVVVVVARHAELRLIFVCLRVGAVGLGLAVALLERLLMAQVAESWLGLLM